MHTARQAVSIMQCAARAEQSRPGGVTPTGADPLGTLLEFAASRRRRRRRRRRGFAQRLHQILAALSPPRYHRHQQQQQPDSAAEPAAAVHLPQRVES